MDAHEAVKVIFRDIGDRAAHAARDGNQEAINKLVALTVALEGVYPWSMSVCRDEHLA